MGFWQVQGKRILVVGAGKSGLAAANVLLRGGANVTLCDNKLQEVLLDSASHLLELGASLHGGGYPDAETFDGIVMSPGVPTSIPLIKRAKELGVPVIGELELAFQLSKAPFAAITGTNGKTTTTALVGEILSKGPRMVLVGGNIGIPLVNEVLNLGTEHLVVAEVSSFQLETVDTFKPLVSAILNITPDHLDRHGTMEEYRRVKAMIFANQGPENFVVLNADDPLVASLAEECKAKVLLFSCQKKVTQGSFLQEGKLMMRLDSQEHELLGIDELQIKGPHNWSNALAASAVCWAAGCSLDVIRAGLKAFQPVAHRMEPAGTVDGVIYINDSKGTNPDATIKALQSYDQPIVLIAGGLHKGSSFAELASVAAKRCKNVVLIGQAAPLLAEALNSVGFTKILQADSMREAVQKARETAREGDLVLLSPACASMDMFKNYEERGTVFKTLVSQMSPEAS